MGRIVNSIPSPEVGDIVVLINRTQEAIDADRCVTGCTVTKLCVLHGHIICEVVGWNEDDPDKIADTYYGCSLNSIPHLRQKKTHDDMWWLHASVLGLEEVFKEEQECRVAGDI